MYAELEPAATKPVLSLPVPLLRAQRLDHVTLRRRDPAKMAEFLADFGFVTSGEAVGRRYLRAHGEGPAFSLEILPGETDEFIGFAFGTSEAEDLQLLSRETGTPVTAEDRPGGGQRLRLTDPNGFQVDLIHGAQTAHALTTRQAISSVNVPGHCVRVNRPLRTAAVAAPVMRLGHVVLQVADLAESLAWYVRYFGLLLSDVQLVGDSIPILAFARFDRGATPSDHHSLALLAGPAPRLLHVSTETLDIDAVGQGHQYLRARGWKHHWGLGRHILGSQFFDYWKDPTGTEWEHYSDGDLLTANFPTGYWKLTRGTLWAWGHDLPADAVPLDPPAPDAPEYANAIFRALEVPPRPWLR